MEETVYYSLYQFSKAYQVELIRSVTGSTLTHNSSSLFPPLWRRSLNSMGDVFIALGLRMKGQARYRVDLSRSRV
jgi:hypothetical protein